MPESALGIQSRVWRWILVLGPVLVAALGIQTLWTLRTAAERPDSTDMSVESDRVARLIDAYITRVVGVTSHLAITPDVVKLAESGPESPPTPEDKTIESRWLVSANTEDDFYTRTIHDRPVSRFFADVKGTDSAYREIFLADRGGRVVAASNRTENYLQDKDPWWPKDLETAKPLCRRSPVDCVSLSSIEWDASAGLFGYDVVLPVVNTDDQPVGVLKAVVDPSELDGLLKFAALSRNLDVTLINAKGVQIFSREPFFTDLKTAPRLQDLLPGNEGSWPLTDAGRDGPVAFVRRLSSPVQGGWFVAIADRDHHSSSWKPYALWGLFTVGMFLITAGAFAVRLPDAAEGSEEGEAHEP
jgi:hypothetical protein